MLRSRGSPYLNTDRLGDVLAAIQAMAVHERYRQSCAEWAGWISGDESRSDYWQQVFDDHPEFFRRSPDGDYSLVLRRALVTQSQQNVRPALSEAQIETLVDMAIKLHSNELEASRDWRWWIARAISFAGSFIGAILAFAAAALFKTSR